MVWHLHARKGHNRQMQSSFNGYPDSWYTASSQIPPGRESLNGEATADVCVIGAGYTGLSAALHLKELGHSVIALEAERVGWGASGRNGGHVGTGQRADQLSLEAWFGQSAAQELWRLGLEAVELVTDLVAKHQIQCEFGEANVHFAAKRSHVAELKEEIEHLQTHYNYSNIEGVDKHSLHEVTSGVGFHYAAIDRGARHLHPLKYCLGLAQAVADAGATIFERSKVTSLTQTEDGVGVTTEGGHVNAKKVVIACNGYLDTLFAPIASNIMPINNFIVATEPLDEAVAARLNPLNASLSDSLFVINYWKLSRDRRLIFGGGETYSDKFPDSITDFVRPKLLAIYPELSTTKLDFGWGGTLAITRNRMPDLGVSNGSIFYAQGFSGHGVPTATMAGKLIALAINGGHEDFDLMAGLKTRKFPGGPLLRRPSLIAGMLFYSLRDRLGR